MLCSMALAVWNMERTGTCSPVMGSYTNPVKLENWWSMYNMNRFRRMLTVSQASPIFKREPLA